MTTSAFNVNDFNNAMEKAIAAATESAKVAEPHWYPCGFAWLSLRCRKNAKIGKALNNMGFRWNSYEKAWQSSMYSLPCADGMGQSMDYRARILQAACDVLHAHGYKDFYVTSRAD